MTTTIITIILIAIVVIAATLLFKKDVKSRKYRIVKKVDNLKGETKYVIEYRSFLNRSWSEEIPVGIGRKKKNFSFDNEDQADRQYKILIGENERFTETVIKSNSD